MSAFNRTAPVDAEGTWVLPNVPANLGLTRVRAVCIENGVARYGASPLISVPANGVLTVREITFSEHAPIPEHVELSASSTVLRSLGETLALRTLAFYPGGTSADVSSAEVGTDYRSSNPVIISVSSSGLATARAAGVAILSAAHEGALGVLRVEVRTSGDSDGDGLPDDWEIANGFDPNDPIDGLDDLDNDGLSTAREYVLGSLSSDPDTDDDGLLDGREVDQLGTNALLADTDGDLFRDGLEVETGSNPLDAASFNLAGSLASLEITPSEFRLIYNVVLGEASRALAVTGRLRDGTVLDVTARRFGTSFSSSALAVLGFGAEDGRVYAGADGDATITASVGAFSASTHGTVSTFSPIPISFVRIPGYAHALDVEGDFAYLAAGATGLQIVDVSNLTNPRVVASFDTPGNARDVVVDSGMAFLADEAKGLVLVDVQNPSQPHFLARIDTSGPANGVAVSGTRAFVANGQGLAVFDVSDPTQPQPLGNASIPGLTREANRVAIRGDRAVVTAIGRGLSVFDITNPSTPLLRGTTAAGNTSDLALRGDLAYVATGYRGFGGGLRVFDLREPRVPGLASETADSFSLTAIALERGLAIASDYWFTSAAPIFRAAPEALQFLGRIDFLGRPQRIDKGNDIVVRDGVVFVAAINGLPSTDVTGDSSLQIGRYADLTDTGGVGPTVSLVAPPDGVGVSERARVQFRADARDDLAVSSVTFSVGGEIVGTDYEPPFETSFAVPSGITELRAQAVARDGAQNSATSAEITLPVLPNARPTVAFVAPAIGGRAVRGSTVSIVLAANDDHGVERVEVYRDNALVTTLSTTPYSFELPVVAAGSTLNLSARAFDDQGASDLVSLSIAIDPDAPPAVAVVHPSEGAEIVGGAILTVRVAASDDVAVSRVRLEVDGHIVDSRTAPPFDFSIATPSSGLLRLRAIAEDSRLQVGTSSEVSVRVIPDPLTSVRGRVVDESGLPFEGAVVESLGIQALTDAEGSFLLEAVPTSEGDLTIAASAHIGAQTYAGAFPSPVSPVPGGVVDVGSITLRPLAARVSIVGHVVNTLGNAVEGATVLVRDVFSVYSGITAVDGRFQIDGVPASTSIDVIAKRQAGSVLSRGRVSTSSGTGGASTDVGTIRLTTVNTTGDPRTTVVGGIFEVGAGIEVRIFTTEDVYSTTTFEDGAFGSFELSGVPTREGPIYAAATVEIDGVPVHGKTSGLISPVAGDITDLGELFLGVGPELAPAAARKTP